MDTHIRPLDKLSINEVCELAKGAAYRGETLEQANVFTDQEARCAFEAAFKAHAQSVAASV